MRTAGTDSSAVDGPGVFDNEAMTFVNEIYQRADAFLFGRRTYELFAGYWGVEEDRPEIRTTPSVGLEHQAQVRGIDYAHQSEVGGHDRPLR